MSATPTVLVIRHLLFEDLGIFAPVLTESGYRIDYVDAGIDRIDPDAVYDADLLVVLGGPIGVGDQRAYPYLTDEIAAIAERIDRGLPTLGVCLGAQLIAAALGAAVEPTGRIEIGYAPLTFADVSDNPLAMLGQVPVLHWHGDQFAIPDGARLLASTPGFPHQAFDYGPAVLALQFHLEADHDRIEQWLIGHAHELATNGIDPAAIRADAGRYGPQLADHAREVFAAWLRSAGAPGTTRGTSAAIPC